MHALVLRLLQQVMNPAVITLESPQTTQVSLHSANHARDTSDTFQEDDSVHPLTLVQLYRVISSDCVKDSSGELNCVPCDFIADATRLLMCIFDLLQILLLIDWMSHSITLRIKHDFVLDHFV